MRGATLFATAFAIYLVNFTHATDHDQAGLLNKRTPVEYNQPIEKVTAGGTGIFDSGFPTNVIQQISNEMPDNQHQATRRRKKRSLKYSKRLGVPIVGDSVSSSPLSDLDILAVGGSLPVGKDQSNENGASASTAGSNTGKANSADHKSGNLVNGVSGASELVGGLTGPKDDQKAKAADAGGLPGVLSNRLPGGLSDKLPKRDTGFPENPSTIGKTVLVFKPDVTTKTPKGVIDTSL
jgi:hypothetical protein